MNRKTHTTAGLILLTLLAGAAPLGAEYVGAGLGLALDLRKQSTEGTTLLNGDYSQTTTESLTTLDEGAFLAYPWVQISVSRQEFLQGKTETKTTYKDSGDTDTTETQLDSLEASALYLSVLGKYPMNQGSYTLWPGLGLAYENAIAVMPDGENDTSTTEANNWYLQAGAGADFVVHPYWMIQPSLLLRWNLTPANADDYDLGILFGLRLGYEL